MYKAGDNCTINIILLRTGQAIIIAPDSGPSAIQLNAEMVWGLGIPPRRKVREWSGSS